MLTQHQRTGVSQMGHTDRKGHKLVRKTILAIIIVIAAALGAPGASATEDLPRTFGGCVAAGGNVRQVDGDMTCRLVRSYDFRVYGSGETECGEEIMLEVWGETRTGVVTYLLSPQETVDLPVLGEDDMVLPATPIPCLDD